MENQILRVSLLGGLRFDYGENHVDDTSGHSKKIWLLLAYLVCIRGRAASREELAGLLWPEDKRPTNLTNAMKTTLFRVRASLEQLYEGAGHQLGLSRESGYAWNTELPLLLDVDEFRSLCASRGERQLEDWLQAAELFGEGFLPKLRENPWAAETAAQLRRLYIETVLGALPLLEERRRWKDAAELCREAILRDPLNEELYCRRMSALLRMGENRAAALVYEDMNQFFLSQAGALPGEEAQTIYRRAVSGVSSGAVASAAIVDQLSEGTPSGAYFCEYDVFRAIYRLQVRDSARSGEETSLAVLTVVHKYGGELNRRSLDLVMGNLLRLIPELLRHGDAVAQCSASQYVLLLPRAGFQDGREVCRRISRAFARQYPHSPATLQVTVCPLKPGEQVPVPVDDPTPA